MEHIFTEPIGSGLSTADPEVESASRNLDLLLKENSETARERSLYPTFADELVAKTMRRPLDERTAFAYFGLMLGTLPPASFFLLFILKESSNEVHPIVFVLMGLTASAASIVGYNLGKLIGKISRKIETRTFTQRIVLYVLLGLSWGIVAGAAGGIFLFLIGAVFGAAIGGAVGAVALATFSIPYRAMKTDGLIDLKHFLPISLGVTLSICAYILGFLYR